MPKAVCVLAGDVKGTIFFQQTVILRHENYFHTLDLQKVNLPTGLINYCDISREKMLPLR